MIILCSQQLGKLAALEAQQNPSLVCICAIQSVMCCIRANILLKKPGLCFRDHLRTLQHM